MLFSFKNNCHILISDYRVLLSKSKVIMEYAQNFIFSVVKLCLESKIVNIFLLLSFKLNFKILR